MQKRVLVLNGAIKKSGNTDSLLYELINGRDDCEIITRENSVINPCSDCGGCIFEKRCRLSDGMDKIYSAINNIDKVIIASPVYFSSLPGFLMDILSRFQCFFGNDRSVLPIIGKPKAAAVILTAGGSGSTDCAERSARLFTKMLNAKTVTVIKSLNTDKIPAIKDAAAVKEVAALRESWFGVGV